MGNEELRCREGQCPVTFLGGTEEGTREFRARHEAVVHGAVYVATKPALDEPIAYVRRSVTSLSAAQTIRAQAVVLKERVFVFLRERGPATDQQIQDALGMDPSTERPRRVELVRENRVRDSGRTTKTHSGRGAVLWEIVL